MVHMKITQLVGLFIIGAALLMGSPCYGQSLLDGDRIPTGKGDLIIQPINHATFIMQWDGHVIYVDPVGGAKKFEGKPKPNIILLTDIHGDHLNGDTLLGVAQDSTVILSPPAVLTQIPAKLKAQVTTLTNLQTKTVASISFEAMPAYNTTAGRTQFHAKGRGNGYLLTLGGKRVYISGDTEDIPEMLALKNIDVAFLCVNLPYTMTVDQAANAVRTFKPKIVYPYHSRGSDLDKLKKLVGNDLGVDVRLRNWYP